MWSIDPKIPLGLWWALAVLSAAAIGFYATRGSWNLSPARRTVVTALMGLGMVGPLLIALNPMWVETIPPPPGQPVLNVLVDGTMSMQTCDVDKSKSTTRWDAALAAADRIRGDARFELRRFAFDNELHPLPSKSKGEASSAVADARDWPRGHYSDLANVLRAAIRGGSPAGHAVLLISDGAHNAGPISGLIAAAREAKSLDVPVYTVTLGDAVQSKNLSLAARYPRMIAFPENPLVLRVRVGQSGLVGKSAAISLMLGDKVMQSRNVRLTKDPAQEVAFVLARPPVAQLQRYLIVAQPLADEATVADNQTTIVVQQLQKPIGTLLLEGKPYWDSKFLARNLGADPILELTSMVRVAEHRVLTKKFPRPIASPSPSSPLDSPFEKEANEKGEPSATPPPPPAASDTPSADWQIQTDVTSPLESMKTLSQYSVVILGRDADVFLTAKGIENLREWLSTGGGCLICARGAPANEIVSKLAEILPVEWSQAAEARFRTAVSRYGYDAAVFDPLMPDGSDPLKELPSLAASGTPKTRVGLPQVLVESSGQDSGESIPVVTYQPYGRGQTIVVEGAGMWRWAFLPPQHAAKDKIYPALWQSMIQWIVSQQDLMPGQEMAIRSDRATFLTGDRATATLLLSPESEFRSRGGQTGLEVLLEGPGLRLPRRVTPSQAGSDGGLFRVDFGTLDVGYYTASVIAGDRGKPLAETAIEVRDPWFERLELDARPDVMRRVAEVSGGQAIDVNNIEDVGERFRQRVAEGRQQKEIRTTLWDRPLVLVTVLSAWLCCWIVRRRSGLV